MTAYFIAHSIPSLQPTVNTSRTLPKDPKLYDWVLRRDSIGSVAIVEEIQRLVNEFRRISKISILWRTEGEAVALAPATARVLYSAAQEALSNVRLHADASEVMMTLAFTTEKVWLVLEDNGKARAPQKFGYGLSAVRDRVHELGGRFAAGPRQEGGFRLVVKLDKDLDLKKA
ncbi:MAG: hypothetical protein R2873_29935 [Caldilineaceae bacterium]